MFNRNKSLLEMDASALNLDTIVIAYTYQSACAQKYMHRRTCALGSAHLCLEVPHACWHLLCVEDSHLAQHDGLLGIAGVWACGRVCACPCTRAYFSGRGRGG